MSLPTRLFLPLLGLLFSLFVLCVAKISAEPTSATASRAFAVWDLLESQDQLVEPVFSLEEKTPFPAPSASLATSITEESSIVAQDDEGEDQVELESRLVKRAMNAANCDAYCRLAKQSSLVAAQSSRQAAVSSLRSALQSKINVRPARLTSAVLVLTTAAARSPATATSSGLGPTTRAVSTAPTAAVRAPATATSLRNARTTTRRGRGNAFGHARV